MRLSLFIITITTTVFAQPPTPRNPCPADTLWRCCERSVNPTDQSLTDVLRRADVDPSGLIGQVGVNCEDAGGDTDCPGTDLCCAQQQVGLLMKEGIDISCQPPTTA